MTGTQLPQKSAMPRWIETTRAIGWLLLGAGFVGVVGLEAGFHSGIVLGIILLVTGGAARRRVRAPSGQSGGRRPRPARPGWIEPTRAVGWFVFGAGFVAWVGLEAGFHSGIVLGIILLVMGGASIAVFTLRRARR